MELMPTSGSAGLPLTFQSVRALLLAVPGSERLLRSKGIQEVPEPIVPGITGDARVDGLLIEWFNERRVPESRPRTQSASMSTWISWLARGRSEALQGSAATKSTLEQGRRPALRPSSLFGISGQF